MMAPAFSTADRMRAAGCNLRARSARYGARGLTLIEIIVVLVLIGVVSVAVVSGTSQLPGARLKRTAAMLSSAIKVAYTRATATSRHVRLVFDLESHEVWLEESASPMLLQTKDKSGAGGAEPITEQEKIANAEAERIVKGPVVPKPMFKKVESIGFGDDEGGEGGKKLSRGIKFRSVATGHDEEPRTVGRAYLYFWPGGLTERAAIQLRIGDSSESSQIMSLVVSPLTGKVTIKSGPAEIVAPRDDRESSEREDNGP